MSDKIKRIFIDETSVSIGMHPFLRYRSFCERRNGIFTPLERARLKHSNVEIFYKHSDSFFQEAFLCRNPSVKPYSGESYDLLISSEGFCSWDILPKISKVIDEDLNISREFDKWKNKFKVKSDGFAVVGKNKHIYIHPSATIYPGVVLDTTDGPIIIDKDVKITSFSFLEGPVYIAPNSSIDNARITGGTIIGNTCKIGGEVENSIFENFSNKHHEGFVGHSHIGCWVNFGALATTSDLKNNYGMIRLKVGNESINTETIKFGSIIGDFCKIAIGVMINTGSVIDLGSNVTQSRVKGYLAPFTWAEGAEKYRLDHFLNDAKKIMARRNKVLTIEEERLLRNLYEVQI